MDLTERPRRLRSDGIRELVSETVLRPADLVAPVFVDATAEEATEISSLPGYDRHPIDSVGEHVTALQESGVRAIILFGIPSSKDETGSTAFAEDGVIQRALRTIDDDVDDDLTVITDVCLCEYTSHGHCGVLEAEGGSLTVDNDPSVELLAQIAISHARAGADVVAPSASLDGMVAGIRERLDSGGYEEVPILSYAVKYHSGFYGPFRDAADGAPAFGDRRHYQQNPANRREARLEAQLDIEQGADMIMVKPAMPYLDIISLIRDSVDVPVAAYQVSGEYAMLHAAAERGWLDLESVAIESLLGIKRAGATPIISYLTPYLLERELI